MTDPAIAAAAARAAAARARLTDALDTLKARLSPKTIARDVAGGAAEVVVANRWPAAGAAALAALFLARRPIKKLLTNETDAAPARSANDEAPLSKDET